MKDKLKTFGFGAMKFIARHIFLLIAAIYAVAGDAGGFLVMMIIALYFKADDIYEAVKKQEPINIGPINISAKANKKADGTFAEEHF